MNGLNLEKYKHFLEDFGCLLREQALEVKERAKLSAGSGDETFLKGQLFSYYAVFSLIKHEAEVFDIPMNELNLQDIDPEDLRV
jgi:hypothetical protein